MYTPRSEPHLIEQMFAEAIVSDYPSAAGRSSPRRQRRTVLAVTSAATGLVLALGISVRVLNDPAVIEQREGLMVRIMSAEERRDANYEATLSLRRELSTAREAELQSVSGGAELAASVSAHEESAGLTGRSGPGATVTLTDAKARTAESEPGAEQVLDTDVQRAVNGLWRSGAVAIAVNDQRLSARTAIRSAAGALLVNYRALRPPYAIVAVGPTGLAEAFQAGSEAAALRTLAEDFGIGLEVAASTELTVPAAAPALPETSRVFTGGAS
jgi:uncharacterized protein YlxW (UPF0749 family)